MSRQGNRRTTKEGSSDFKFQNFNLPKNRCWPWINSAPGQQYQTFNKPLLHLHQDRNFAAVLDPARGCSDEEYEDPEVHALPTWKSLKILPARPIKESEYADTRCFKSMADTSLSLAAKDPSPMEDQAWKVQRRSGDISKVSLVDQPLSKDPRRQCLKVNRPTKGNKTPPPPPRPPVPLPKKFQPLPPEPQNTRCPLPLRHPFPEGQQVPRQISLRNLSEVLGAEKVPCQQMRPPAHGLSQNQNHQETPPPSSSSVIMSNQSGQNRGKCALAHPDRSHPHLPWSCQPPASYHPGDNSLDSKHPGWKAPYPLRPYGQEIPHQEWYIGDFSRQAVEEALMKESKDGTFLVRDCSSKSRAEPYVLVVFYRSKVYNVKIRFLERNQQFALGTGRRGDEKFDSVEDIIEHYKFFPIVLIDGKDKTGVRREQCYLTQPLPLHRHCSSR